MSLPASTAHLAAVTILTMWAESSTGMTGVHTLLRAISVPVDSTKTTMSLTCVVETRGSARCAEVTVEVDILKSARFKDKTTGAFGVHTMKNRALRTSVVKETLKGLQM
jgi:hypothetical protein